MDVMTRLRRLFRAAPIMAFTASNPTFDGVVLVKASTGSTVVRLQSSSGGSIVFNSTSGAQKAVMGYDGVGDQFLLDSTPDVEIRTDGDLLLNPTGSVFVGSGGSGIRGVMMATQVWNPPSIASGTAATISVTVTGAAVGDAVFVANEFAQDDTNLKLEARVSSANTVTLYLHNTITAGGAIDPSTRTLRVVVIGF